MLVSGRGVPELHRLQCLLGVAQGLLRAISAPLKIAPMAFAVPCHTLDMPLEQEMLTKLCGALLLQSESHRKEGEGHWCLRRSDRADDAGEGSALCLRPTPFFGWYF